jgi:hypothetical protein
MFHRLKLSGKSEEMKRCRGLPESSDARLHRQDNRGGGYRNHRGDETPTPGWKEKTGPATKGIIAYS